MVTDPRYSAAPAQVASGRAHRIGFGLLAVVGCGLGATLLFWHGESLQLHPLGANFAWPAIAGAGVIAMTRGRSAGRSVGALIIGSAFGVIAAYEGLNYLPATPLGSGIAIGIGLALFTTISFLSRGRVPFGPGVVALGLGVGAAQIVPAGPTTTPTDVLAIWTAVAFALGLGVAVAVVAEALLPAFVPVEQPADERLQTEPESGLATALGLGVAMSTVAKALTSAEMAERRSDEQIQAEAERNLSAATERPREIDVRDEPRMIDLASLEREQQVELPTTKKSSQRGRRKR